jgi:hypothetical protein
LFLSDGPIKLAHCKKDKKKNKRAWAAPRLILYINSLSACVRLSVRPVTLCVVTGPEPEPLLQFVPEISTTGARFTLILCFLFVSAVDLESVCPSDPSLFAW